MLGIDDPIIAFVYIANIVAVSICIIYGIINWNKGADNEAEEIAEEELWEKEEAKLDEEL
ncbi:MAG: hypothetical protein D6B27_01575 [Gammaproteobacteria bacterium]|nr:MAG: hypothetical protein D6B27_01575 [Gammaproteobacteria bacterium]